MHKYTVTSPHSEMLFNSLQFLVFFPIVVLLYWLLPSTGKWRNTMLLLASYYFYMNWEPVYALLILFSTATTWAGGLLIDRYGSRGERRKGKYIIAGTVCINLVILFTYKYLGFVGDQLRLVIDHLGFGMSVPEFELLLPVGLSFYTFQAIGYIVDVWRGSIRAERNFFTYALFVSFFPQLVAGPIERAKNLLIQFHVPHIFSGLNLIRGMELMIFGYFMKLCVAENVAPYVDAVFNNMAQHNGNSIILATFFFTFQIFCDFGGYSLIAIGASRCMGFTLMQNFRQPYLARSVKDFWRRWHISLSSWFSDYVYIPLGGNRVGPARHYANLFITFLVSGIWHGANYTFLMWGAYHGALQCGHTAWKKCRPAKPHRPAWLSALNILFTFILISLGWIFFRANSLADAMMAYRKILFERGMIFNGDGKPALAMGLLLIMLLMIFEIIRERRDVLNARRGDHRSVEKSIGMSVFTSAFLLIVILLTAQFSGGQFIYFQF